MKKYRTPGNRIFNACNYLIMIVLLLATLYPIYHVVVASFSDPILLMSHKGPLLKILGDPTLEGYRKTLANRSLLTGFRNTLFYVTVGTFLQVMMTSFAAFLLTRKAFLPRKLLMKMMIFTMFFGGGLIPFFFAIKNTGVYNTIWVSSIPYLISTYNVIIMRTFFMTIPESLEEAALIDGANDFQVFKDVIMPLSKPVIAVIILYCGVSQWNSWFPAAMFVRDRGLYPLQMILREILIQNDSTAMTDSVVAAVEESYAKELVKYCTIVVSTVPILVIYPFLQKYFEKGVMIGAVKG